MLCVYSTVCFPLVLFVVTERIQSAIGRRECCWLHEAQSVGISTKNYICCGEKEFGCKRSCCNYVINWMMLMWMKRKWLKVCVHVAESMLKQSLPFQWPKLHKSGNVWLHELAELIFFEFTQGIWTSFAGFYFRIVKLFSWNLGKREILW